MTTILLTGGSGFIGGNLVRDLLRRDGYHVVNVDKQTYAANPLTLADLAEHPRYRHDAIDIGDVALIDVLRATSPDAIIHLAAESHVDRSIDRPVDFVSTNIVGTAHLLNATLDYWQHLAAPKREAFRLLHVSTDEVFGSLESMGSFREDSPYRPRSPYAASKASADHLVRAWHTTYGLPVIVSNCSNNYGPFQFPEKLIPLTIIRALREQSLPVYGDGQQRRDWIHVSDHLSALVTILRNGRVGETYNVGAHQELANLEVVQSICRILDDIKPRSSGSYADLITHVADRPGHDRRYAMDATKLQRELRWQPRVDFESGLRETVQWYVSHPKWWQLIVDETYDLARLGVLEQGESLP